jgi:hypothetical protein
MGWRLSSAERVSTADGSIEGSRIYHRKCEIGAGLLSPSPPPSWILPLLIAGYDDGAGARPGRIERLQCCSALPRFLLCCAMQMPIGAVEHRVGR